MDTKLNINSIEAGSITYDKLNQDVVDKFNAKADSASVTNVSNRVTAIEGLIATDSDAVIDKGDEVVTFLDGISATDDLEGILANKANTSTVNDLLDGKLDRTGGVMELDTIRSLEIKRKGSMSTIYFSNTNGALGFIGFNASAQPIIADATGGVSNIILHEGNVGDYALKTDGSNAMKGGIDWNDVSVGVDVDDFGTGLIVGKTTADGTSLATYGYKYASVLNVSDGSYRFQIASAATGGNKLFYRGYDANAASYGDWKTIAFTDSDITGNAATATKLKDKVSLWGNEFDGTKDIVGGIYFSANQAALYVNSGVGDSLFLQVNADQNLLVGQGIAKLSKDTLIYGNNIKFCYGTAGSSTQTAMTITDGGNVNIGTAFEGFKFSVYGGMTFLHGVESSALVLGQMPTNGLLVGNTNYGIGQWFQGGQGHIQASSFGNTTATAYALNLNPFGGAVNVGEGGLNVAGGIKSGDKFLLTTTAMNLGSATTPLYLFLARPDANYIWASANGGYISLGVCDTGATSSANATLSIYSDRVVSGQRNNAVSLGTSSYRWSNVYSVGGNFSGRVLIGGAEDDENYALNVKGAAKFKSTDWHTESTVISYSGLSLYGRDSGMYAQGLRFYAYDGTSLGHIGFYNGYFYIGKNQDTPWFYINSTESAFNVLTKFNGGALIPTGQKLTIGDAVLEYDGGLKSSHNFIGNLTGTATKVSNVLKFGSKTFDGSSEQTITATDLGVTSSTISDGGFTKNAGTVTSVATGTGLTGGTITGTGTISLDSTYQTYCTNGNAAGASYTTATSIASIPVGYKLVKCTISASGSFALASTSITAGREIHIIIYNSSSSDVVVSLPTAAPYVNFSADSLTVPANRYAEINVISDGSNLYIRTLA